MMKKCMGKSKGKRILDIFRMSIFKKALKTFAKTSICDHNEFLWSGKKNKNKIL
jgi:hypothetical protein